MARVSTFSTLMQNSESYSYKTILKITLYLWYEYNVLTSVALSCFYWFFEFNNLSFKDARYPRKCRFNFVYMALKAACACNCHWKNELHLKYVGKRRLEMRECNKKNSFMSTKIWFFFSAQRLLYGLSIISLCLYADNIHSFESNFDKTCRTLDGACLYLQIIYKIPIIT